MWAAAVLAACREVPGWRLGKGTHRKHGPHASDAGRVEVQRLVEGRVLPSLKRWAYEARSRCGPGGERAVGGAAQVACRRRGLSAGSRGDGYAHHKHFEHGRDAGRVEAQRLVEGLRALPSRKVSLRSGVGLRAGRGEKAVGGGTTRRKPHAGKGSAVEVGARTRTLNMASMFVTLDVSKLSGWLKAHAPCRVARWAYEAGVEVRAGR